MLLASLVVILNPFQFGSLVKQVDYLIFVNELIKAVLNIGNVTRIRNTSLNAERD